MLDMTNFSSDGNGSRCGLTLCETIEGFDTEMEAMSGGVGLARVRRDMEC